MQMNKIPEIAKRFSDQAISAFKRVSIFDVGIILAGIILAILIRYPLLSFSSHDYFYKIRVWTEVIRHGGFWIFRKDFSTYNPPYLYLLYLMVRFFPDTRDILIAKIPSLITDFICAYFVYLIVKIKYPNRFYPVLAAFAFLFLPTVILNSAFWGQADVLYTAPLLACLYFLIKKENVPAFLAFGVSLAFKLQAIFLAPLLLALFFRKEVSWKHFLLIPLVLFLAIVPSWIAGRPLMELISVYLFQADLYQQLTMVAATAYTWIPDIRPEQIFFTPVGITFTAMLSFFFAVLVYKSRAKLTPSLLIKLGLVSVLFVPFFLPRMHDRYFYPADVFSIVFAFFYPEYFLVPVVIELVSFFSYQPTLFNVTPIPFGILSGGIFVVLVFLVKDVVMTLFGKGETDPSAQTQYNKEVNEISD
jgi:Gpi18-like mannosyltransferase